MTQSTAARRLIALAVLSMLISLPATAGAVTSNNPNHRPDALLVSGQPIVLSNPLATPTIAVSSHPPCITVRCKRAVWRKHHPQPKYPTQHAQASWYAPGGTTASGRPYRPGDMGVANKTMPFGTRLRICYQPPYTSKRFRHCAKVTVVDRGPFVSGRTFDLQLATKEAIRFPDLGQVTYEYIGKSRRKR